MKNVSNFMEQSNGLEEGKLDYLCTASPSQTDPIVFDSKRVAMIAGTSVSALLVLCIINVVPLLCYRRSLKAV